MSKPKVETFSQQCPGYRGEVKDGSTTIIYPLTEVPTTPILLTLETGVITSIVCSHFGQIDQKNKLWLDEGTNPNQVCNKPTSIEEFNFFSDKDRFTSCQAIIQHTLE